MTVKHAPAAYQPDYYPSPIELPPSRSGRMEIRHRIIPKGQRVDVVGAREALLRGIAPVRVQFDAALKVHELVEHRHHGGANLWMTDMPVELNQIAEMLWNVGPHGRVLVGGLGLGVLPRVLQEISTVLPMESITVVERSADVIALTGHQFNGPNRVPVHVVHSSIMRYLARTKTPFDYYLLDTWAGTSEGDWWKDVMPLQRRIRNRFGAGPVIHCWAENIMRAQLLQALTTKPPHWYYRGLPMPLSMREALFFLDNVGTEAWERLYGVAVDQTFTAMAEERRDP